MLVINEDIFKTFKDEELFYEKYCIVTINYLVEPFCVLQSYSEQCYIYEQ